MMPATASYPLLPLAAADPDAVETLLDAAFGPDRRGRTAYRLRAGVEPLPDLSFAALEGDELIGTLQSWPVQVAGTPLVLVGPVAVAPQRQGSGLGRAMMTALIEQVDVAPATPPLVLIGDPEYYGRFFGFTAAATGGWTLPGPVERRRLLARVPAGMTLPATGLLGPRLV